MQSGFYAIFKISKFEFFRTSPVLIIIICYSGCNPVLSVFETVKQIVDINCTSEPVFGVNEPHPEVGKKNSELRVAPSVDWIPKMRKRDLSGI